MLWSILGPRLITTVLQNTIDLTNNFVQYKPTERVANLSITFQDFHQGDFIHRDPDLPVFIEGR